jgi:hypothetical protein
MLGEMPYAAFVRRSHAIASAMVVMAACGPGGDPAPDASPPRGWATYVIEAGRHDARLLDREPKNPIDGVVSVVGRDYELVLDPSAIYELTDPVQPDDQFDWNKLPGLSDCHTVDLAVDGIMLGWRWRLDLEPRVLELSFVREWRRRCGYNEAWIASRRRFAAC